MKKMTAFFLALLMVLSMCSFAAAEEEPMVINYISQAGPVDPEGIVLKTVEEKFNVKINFLGHGLAAARTMLAAGDIPDFMCLKMDDYSFFANEGVLGEVPVETIKEHAPYLYGVWNDISADLDIWKVNGVNYAIPVLDSERGGASHMLAYRGDWLEALGYEKAPETLEELEKFVYDVAQKDPDGDGVANTYGFAESGLQQVYGAFGALPQYFCVLDDGTVSHGCIQPEMKEALALLNKWYKDGVISPQVNASEYDLYTSSQFANGEIAISVGNVLCWKGKTFEGARDGATYAELAKQNPEAAEKIVFGTPVVGPYGDSGVAGSTVPHTWTMAVGKHVEDDPAKLAKILEIQEYYSNTVETWVFARFGVEGTHFNYGEYTFSNGVTCYFPQPIDPYGNWNTVVSVGAGTIFDLFTPMTSQAALPETAWLANEHPELIERFENGKAYYDVMYLKPTIWADYSAELETLRQTAYAEFITGQRDLAEWDQFVADWLAYGGQEVLDAIAAGDGKVLR